MAKVGRKSKLTYKTVKKIRDFIAMGNYIETACRASGISDKTYYYWLSLGRDAKAQKIENPYSEFLDVIKEAESEAEANLVTTIKKASFDSWQAAAFLLERKNPKNWGKKESIDHSLNIPDNKKISDNVEEILKDENLRKASDEILKRLSDRAEEESSEA